MRGVIFGAAPLSCDPFYLNQIKKDDVILCADGGLAHVNRLGLIPQAVIGDFDSADRKVVPHDALVHPMEKDDTDMALCLKYAIENHVDSVLIFGGLSGRLDHTLANIHLLKYGLDHHTHVELIDESTKVLLIRDHIRLPKEDYQYLSAFPLGGTVTGVTYQGLKYPLNNATLVPGIPLGVSNQFSEEWADIKISSGELLLLLIR